MTCPIASIAPILISLAIAVSSRRRGRKNRWGLDPDRVKAWVYEVCQEYPKQLTLRALFYRLVMRYGFPNGAYKWLSRWAKRWRFEDPWLMDKFIDLGRLPIIPEPPSLRKIEVWTEKQSTYVLLKDIFDRFRIPVQIQRGYGSVSLFVRAVRRAQKKGVETLAYLGDIDPSGLDIERITRERMIPVKIVRVALTWNQIQKYRLPPRPAKPKDRRTPRYIEKYGDQTYEIEALDPKILRQITEQKLRKLIPPEELRELELREKAARIAVELLKPIRERVERMVRKLLGRGLSLEEIRRRLESRIGF